MNNPPDLTQERSTCDCKTGRLSKLLGYNKDSRLRARDTYHLCSYTCINCGAIWKAETWLRGKGWTKVKWTKTKNGNRA